MLAWKNNYCTYTKTQKLFSWFFLEIGGVVNVDVVVVGTGEIPLRHPVAIAYGSPAGDTLYKETVEKIEKKNIHTFVHTLTHAQHITRLECMFRIFNTNSVRTKPFCSAVTVRQHFINDTFPGNAKIQVST